MGSEPLDSSRALRDCISDSEFSSCFSRGFDPIRRLDPEASREEKCAADKTDISSHVECLELCPEVSCAVDAKFFIKVESVGLRHELSCGGIDFQQTCETRSFVGNGEPSVFSAECSDDPAIIDCIETNKASLDEDSDTDGCNDLETRRTLVNLTCRRKCDDFQCSDISQESYDVLHRELQFVGCSKPDLKKSCEQGNGELLVQGIPIECRRNEVVTECFEGNLPILENDNVLDEDEDCQDFVNRVVSDFTCLNSCGEFSCDGFGDAAFAKLQATLEGSECASIDLRASCNEVVDAASGLVTNSTLMLAAVMFALRLVK